MKGDPNNTNGRDILLIPDASRRGLSKPVAMHQYDLGSACGTCGTRATKIVVVEMSAAAPEIGVYCGQCADGLSRHGGAGWKNVVG